jgi:hypothetical protein
MVRSGGNGLEYIYVDHPQDMSAGFYTLRNQTLQKAAEISLTIQTIHARPYRWDVELVTFGRVEHQG